MPVCSKCISGQALGGRNSALEIIARMLWNRSAICASFCIIIEKHILIIHDPEEACGKGGL
jgi:hypothetical protein